MRHDEDKDSGAGRGRRGHRGMRGGPHFRGPRGGGWRGRPGPPPPETDDLEAWLSGRLPDDWFTGAPEVTVDREEILVVGTLEDTTVEGDEDATTAARAGRVSRFREDTRDRRIAIAREAESRYERSVAWGVRIDDTEHVFTNLAVPVMTRLRQDERAVLDTLIDAGVARSRSEALAWCVHLVGSHADEWLDQLRDALTEVQRLRDEGPTTT